MVSDDRETSIRTTIEDAPTTSETSELSVTCVLPGSALEDSPSRASDATVVDRYRDDGELACGGMGTVKRMLDQHLMRPVAMKLFERMSRQQALRFLEEAQITGQLDHPNIVPLYDLTVDEEGMPQNFTMKLVQGQTLGALIDESIQRDDQDEALRLERLLRVLIKVCEAVAYAHSRGVVHRDLKPSNIMVGAHGQVYVMDWGVARLRGTTRRSDSDTLRYDPERRSHEEPGMVIGTVSYMAPEQAAGDIEEIGEYTDVFALGGILYKILTGRPPYAGARSWEDVHRQALACDIAPPQQLVSDRPLPPRLCEITMKALAADPSQRYGTMVELQRELEQFLRGGGWFATARFPRGTVIVTQGAHGDCAYIIREGTCEVYGESSEGRTPVTTLGPGEVFGEMAILTDHPRNASVRALTDVEAVVVTRESIDHELERNHWLAIIMRTFAGRYRDVPPSDPR